MFGPVAKTYAASRLEIDPAQMFVTSVMPCTAKKYECQREEFHSSGFQDVDAVLTTRDLAQMIKEAGIDFCKLPEEEADRLIGSLTGAATIFGATGGVMEAALRTAYELVTHEQLARPGVTEVRGLQTVRQACVDLKGTVINVAVVSGLKGVDAVVQDVLAGRSPYHFIEVMNCPGGCVNGGGQPIYREV